MGDLLLGEKLGLGGLGGVEGVGLGVLAGALGGGLGTLGSGATTGGGLGGAGVELVHGVGGLEGVLLLSGSANKSRLGGAHLCSKQSKR